MDEQESNAKGRAAGAASNMRRELMDEALLQDIDLLMHVIAEVAAVRCPLTEGQVDQLLGVERREGTDG